MSDIDPPTTTNSTICLEDILTDVYYRQEIAVIPTTIILILAVLTYGLRIITRLLTKQQIWWDDILMGLGLILAWEPLICQYLLVANGLGHHLCNVPKDQVYRFYRIAFALQRANQPVLCCVKISILLFYHRVFSNAGNASSKFYIYVIVGIVYTLAWGISTWVANLTRCNPIALAYDRALQLKQALEGGVGSCRDPASLGTIVAVLSLVGDIYIIVLPLPILMGLNINRRKKAAVIGIFLVGSLGCIASLVRIFEIANFATTEDPTYASVFAAAWTTLEHGIVIISGNLPMLSPLFRGFFNTNNNNNNNNNNNVSNNNDNGNENAGNRNGNPVRSRNTLTKLARKNSKQIAMGLRRLRSGKPLDPGATRIQEVGSILGGADNGNGSKESSRGVSPPPSYSLRNDDTHQYVATVSAEGSPPHVSLLHRHHGHDANSGAGTGEQGELELGLERGLGMGVPLSNNQIHVQRQVIVVTSSK